MFKYHNVDSAFCSVAETVILMGYVAEGNKQVNVLRVTKHRFESVPIRDFRVVEKDKLLDLEELVQTKPL